MNNLKQFKKGKKWGQYADFRNFKFDNQSLNLKYKDVEKKYASELKKLKI